MRKATLIMIAAGLTLATPDVYAQFNWGKAAEAAVKGYQAYSLTDQQLAEYVKASVDAMDKQNTVLPESSEYTKRLRRLTDGLKSADGIPLNFKVYQVSDLNAFACPDGSVRVYTGLMDVMDDDELLGVIGHEIGHVQKHHSREALKKQLKTEAFRSAVASFGGNAALLSESQLADLGQAYTSAKFSRKQEQEADNCGYDFLKNNGRNPWGMVSAFEKLDKMSSTSNSSYIQKMFSSHPDTQDRIARLSKRATKDGFTRPTATSKSTSTAKTSTSKSTKNSKATTSGSKSKKSSKSKSSSKKKK